MEVPFVDLKAQYNSIREEINKAIQDTLDNTAFILGENVAKFEENFAKFCSAKYAVGVSSGTAALHLALLANGIKKGDEIITVPNTFIATTEAISYVGAKIKFVDIDEKTYTVDTAKIKNAITKKTKAIIPVHLYGHPCDMDPILEIAERHNLKIIEDGAQAHGAEYKGRKVPISGIGCFSFYPGKNLGAYGDGGCVVTNNKEMAERVAMLRNHGRKKGEKYKHSIEGYNYRLDGLQAAILDIKLCYLNNWIGKRRKNAQMYNKLLKNYEEIILPFEANYAKHVYHLYVIRIRKRDTLREYLKKQGISTGIHYPIPLHLQPAYKALGYKLGSFPNAEKCSTEILSLPIYAELTEGQIEHVCNEISKILR